MELQIKWMLPWGDISDTWGGEIEKHVGWITDPRQCGKEEHQDVALGLEVEATLHNLISLFPGGG